MVYMIFRCLLDYMAGDEFELRNRLITGNKGAVLLHKIAAEPAGSVMRFLDWYARARFERQPVDAVANQDLAFRESARYPFEQRMETGWLEIPVSKADAQKTLIFQL